MDDEQTVERIAKALEAYLATRPFAADSERGILEWWLADLAARPHPAALAEALARLEARGRIRRSRLPDGSEIWSATGTQS